MNLSGGLLRTIGGGVFEAGIGTSTGIDAGAGNDEVFNNGTVDVIAKATGGEAFATAIRTGDGDDLIMNLSDGLLTVNAGVDLFGTPMVGIGIGIDAGAGDDVVVNDGTIQVSASAFSLMPMAEAIGIQTGDGDDVIVNRGVVSVDAVNNIFFVGIETAIDSGAGDDLLRLLGDSSVVGAVMLGTGDDVIAFAGDSSFTGKIFAGTGIDTIRIEDRRTLSVTQADLLDFERHEVNQGTLEFAGDYAIAAGGALQAELFNGGHGQLAVIGGDATIGADGEMIVIARPRAYVDGETFDVLVGNSVIGTFATEDLTESRFLSFEVNYLPAEVQIEASVVPFMDAAANPVQQAVGGYLDQITPSATGELADVIGEFQLLSDPSDIDTAFASLSPDSYDVGTRTSVDVARETGRQLQHRLRGVRKGLSLAAKPEALAWANVSPGAFADVFDEDLEKKPAQPFGFWVAGFAQLGDQDASDGFTGFDYTSAGMTFGFDHRLGQEFIAGAGIGYVSTDVDLDDSRGGADIESISASLYGSWFSDNAWIDGVLSYGHQRYDNRRRVTVGMIDETASSDHSGQLFAAALGGGLRFEVGREWMIEPFAALRYTYLDEDGYRESGAGAANLVVDGRTTESLLSEIGMRLKAEFYRDGTQVSPFVGAAWAYDFDIDDRSIRSGFAGAPGTFFTLDGLDIDQHRARVEAGLEISRGNMTGSLQYLGEFSSDSQSHGILASLRFEF